MKKYQRKKKLLNIVLFVFIFLLGILLIQAKAYRNFKTFLPDKKAIEEDHSQNSGIEDIFGREALTDCFGNLFAFIPLYQRAASKKGNLPVFSSESLNYITQLESECCRIDQSGLY